MEVWSRTEWKRIVTSDVEISVKLANKEVNNTNVMDFCEDEFIEIKVSFNDLIWRVS